MRVHLSTSIYHNYYLLLQGKGWSLKLTEAKPFKLFWAKVFEI